MPIFNSLPLLLKSFFYSISSQNIYSCSDKDGYVYTIGGSRRGGVRGSPPLFQIEINNKTILLKRNKRERVSCLSSFYVYTRSYVYQQTFFFQNFPPQPPLWKISGSAPVYCSIFGPQQCLFPVSLFQIWWLNKLIICK